MSSLHIEASSTTPISSIVGQSVVSLDSLETSQILQLIDKAHYIDTHRRQVAHTCAGRVLATLFYEPSTRTRLSFETAMLRLGGQVIGFAGAQLASVTKGETIADTLKTVSNYVDIVAIRHPLEGAALVASQASSVPVINAGDGGHMHPTQTLADLATIQQRFGRVQDITVGFCGDLAYGRTVHSLVQTLCRFGNVRFVCISPQELRMPSYVTDRIAVSDRCSFVEVDDLTKVIGDLDVLYMTRVQKERFEDPREYERLKDCYILDDEKMSHASSSMAVLHPLPRVNEIHVDVDNDPRAAYFQQVRNGMLMRMALESSLLGDELAGYESGWSAREDEPSALDNVTSDQQAKATCEQPTCVNTEHEGPCVTQTLSLSGIQCANPRCVTTVERGLPQQFFYDDISHLDRCYYCEEAVRQ